jgi:hypothetical protein
VDRILLERVEAKRSRDFEAADRLRERLRSMGIEVLDRDRQWRTIGGGGVSGIGGGRNVYRRDDDRSVRGGRGLVTGGLGRPDYGRAVYLAVGERLRRLSFPFKPPLPIPPALSFPPCGTAPSFPSALTQPSPLPLQVPVDEKKVVELIEERTAAKMARDFVAADMVRPRL